MNLTIQQPRDEHDEEHVGNHHREEADSPRSDYELAYLDLSVTARTSLTFCDHTSARETRHRERALNERDEEPQDYYPRERLAEASERELCAACIAKIDMGGDVENQRQHLMVSKSSV